MATHHPDRGGDAVTAARVNETYRRMVEWLKRRERRTDAVNRVKGEAPAFVTKARAAAAAIAAAAALIVLRAARKR